MCIMTDTISYLPANSCVLPVGVDVGLLVGLVVVIILLLAVTEGCTVSIQPCTLPVMYISITQESMILCLLLNLMVKLKAVTGCP